eukprot:TRINITY_DN18614_c4_g1_i1.p1 TRINITY_DN18614_c4_g1~~TRINITY_DN18614_c4_g1_i1.p1  ORF type:complete len:200 (-),score=62.06 TRINITY_DN18614_c4_g1_i1:371-886(-)
MAPKTKKPKRTNKPSPLERMMEAFAIVDLDASRQISREEFAKAMETVGIHPELAEKIFNKFDPDNSGELDSQEFFTYAAKGAGDIKDLMNKALDAAEDLEAGIEKTKEIFRSWDADGNGTISKQELERVLIMLNPSFKKTDINKMFKSADKNKDGVIDYEEFVEWLAKKGK